MKVKELMVRDVKTCFPHDTLNAAAKIMWDYDCGCVPVVDEQALLVGMITDRDLSMAAYTQGTSLTGSQVSSAMAKQVFSCHPDDDLNTAENIMRVHKIRRLPVVDAAGHLVGLISLNDIVREAERERALKGPRQVSDMEIAQTLAAVCASRLAGAFSRAA